MMEKYESSIIEWEKALKIDTENKKLKEWIQKAKIKNQNYKLKCKIHFLPLILKSISEFCLVILHFYFCSFSWYSMLPKSSSWAALT